MEVRDLLQTQKEFDERHGWFIGGESFPVFLEKISDDLVGLIGEVGELANVIKKMKLEYVSLGVDTKSEHMPAAREEIIDILIYLLRIAMHANVDIESEYLTKLKSNSLRFQRYETK